jgi:putative ABC transport system permease protein
MWKEYSSSYLKKNKATSISIMISAFITSLFISLVCGIFYNMWADNIRRIELKEGNWQAHLVGNITKEDIQTIESFSNVKEVVVKTKEKGEGVVVSVFFRRPSSIYKDLPQIAEKIGIDESGIEYHNTLLSQYFIFSPEEKSKPPLLLPFYIMVMIISCFSLVLVIKNAFAVSMNARTHQMGLLQSIGATPKQIRFVLLQEAAALCVLPILIGDTLGIGLCYAYSKFAASITQKIQVENTEFRYNILVFAVTLLVSLITVGLSAWIPAKKLSRLSPLQAIRGDSEEPVKKVKHFRLLSFMMGVEGELARKSLYVRRKAFRTATLSLTLSFLSFSIFMNFITLSDISTKHTYFERYKNTWDILVTIKEDGAPRGDILEKISKISGVSESTEYRKVTAYTKVPAAAISQEVKALGGYEALTSPDSVLEEGYLVKVPIIVLDNESFDAFSTEAGAYKQEVVAVNTIWDSLHSNFRHRKYVPFLEEVSGKPLTLFSDKKLKKETAQVIIGGYVDSPPNLREEYSDFSLVTVMAASTYDAMSVSLPADQEEVYYNIVAASKDDIYGIAEEVEQILQGKYEYVLENRLDKEAVNSEIMKGYKKLMAGLCGLLACIGIANVFANTLGYVYQRKREFARYISIGLTPEGVNKILFMEALMIGLKPIIFSVPFNILFIAFAIKASYLNPMEFISRMPVIPILVFAILILSSVGLSYYIGGRKINKCNILEALKDDTMF